MRKSNVMRQEMEERIRFGGRLKSLRTRFDLKQEDIAKKIGCCPAQISVWEKGNVEVGIYYTVLLAEYFGITVGQLLGTEPITRSDEFEMWRRF